MDVQVTWQWSALGCNDKPGPNGSQGFHMCDDVHWSLKKQGVEPDAQLVAIGDQNVASWEYNRIKTFLDQFLQDDKGPPQRALTFRNGSEPQISHAPNANTNANTNAKADDKHHHHRAASPQKNYSEDVRMLGKTDAQAQSKPAFDDNNNNNNNNGYSNGYNGAAAAAHDEAKTEQQPPHYRDRNDRNKQGNDGGLWFQNNDGDRNNGYGDRGRGRGGGGDRGGGRGRGSRGGYGGDSYRDRGRGRGRGRGGGGGYGDSRGDSRYGGGGGYSGGNYNNFGGDNRSNHGDARSSHSHGHGDNRSNQGNDYGFSAQQHSQHSHYNNDRRGRGARGGGGGGDGYGQYGGGRSHHRGRDDGDSHSVNSWNANFDKSHMSANKNSSQIYDLNVKASPNNANANTANFNTTAAADFKNEGKNVNNEKSLQQIVKAFEFPIKPSYQAGDIVWYTTSSCTVNTPPNPMLGMVKFINTQRKTLVVRPLSKSEMQEVELPMDNICSNMQSTTAVDVITQHIECFKQELATTNQCRVYQNHQRELYQNALVKFKGDLFGTISSKNANGTFEVQRRDECTWSTQQKMYHAMACSQLEIVDETELQCVVRLKLHAQGNVDETATAAYVYDYNDANANDDNDDDDDDVVDGGHKTVGFESSNTDEMKVYDFLDEVADEYIVKFLQNGGTKLSFVLLCDEALLAQIGVKPVHRRYILRKIETFDAQQFETMYAAKCKQRQQDADDKEQQRLQLEKEKAEKEKEKQAQQQEEEKQKEQAEQAVAATAAAAAVDYELKQDRSPRSFNEYPSSSHDEEDDDALLDVGHTTKGGDADSGGAAAGGGDVGVGAGDDDDVFDKPPEQNQEETGYEQDIDDTDLEATQAQAQAPQHHKNKQKNKKNKKNTSNNNNNNLEYEPVTETGYEDDVDEEQNGNGVEAVEHTQNEQNYEDDLLDEPNPFEDETEEKAQFLGEEKPKTAYAYLLSEEKQEAKANEHGQLSDASEQSQRDLMQKRKVHQNETRNDNGNDTSSTSPSVISADEATQEIPQNDDNNNNEDDDGLNVVVDDNAQNISVPVPVPAAAAASTPNKSRTKKQKKQPPPKLIVFDFDETVTAKNLYHALKAMADTTENSAESHVKKLEAMSDEELFDIFGGMARVQMLQERFGWLHSHGVKLAVISYGFTESTKAALKRVDLLQYFDDTCIFGNNSEQLIAAQHNSATCIHEQFGTKYKKSQILFFDDNIGHIENAKKADVCGTCLVDSGKGINSDVLEAVQKICENAN